MNIVFNQNFEALKTGVGYKEYYSVRNGILEIKSKASFLEKIIYFFRQIREGKKVQEIIGKTISQIKPETVNSEELRHLFFVKIGKLSRRIFDRNNIDRSLIPILEPELEKTKKGGSNNEALRKLKRRIKKAELALKLGVELKRIGRGNSGSYYAFDYKGKPVGIFKPSQEESLGSQAPQFLIRIRNLLLKCFFGIEAKSVFWRHEGYLAECMTSKLAEHMHLKTVPFSEVVTLKSSAFSKQKHHRYSEGKGSFQYFIKEAESMDRTLGIYSEFPLFGSFLFRLNTWRNKEKLSEKIDQHQFEEMAALDYLICNRDRHFENLLTTPSKKRKGESDIHLIDHEWSFPKQNPPQKDTLYRHNQYKWAILPQAEYSFSEKMRGNIQENLKGKSLIELLNKLVEVNDSHGSGFNKIEKNSSQALAFKKRIAVLLLSVEKGMTLKQLAKIKSHEEIERFLAKNGLFKEDDLDHYLHLQQS